MDNEEKHKLTAKEEKFCWEYVKRLDAAKAARAAGYSVKTAKQIGWENLTKLYIQSRIKEIREELKIKLGIDDTTVLSELAALSYWNLKDYIEEGNTIRDLSKMSKSKLKPVVGVKTTEKKIIFGETTEIIKTTELKFADKRGALGDLGRHLGVFEKDNTQRQPVLPPVLKVEVVAPNEEDD